MSLKAKILFGTALFLAAGPTVINAGEIKDFPAPFISEDDTFGRNTGIYLPADTTDQELKAALLLRGELGEDTWKEDMLVLGTLDSLDEARDNRILVAAVSDLPEEAKDKLPQECSLLHDQGLCYEYDDEKGTVLVVTADKASLLPQTAAFFLDKDAYSEIEASYICRDLAPEEKGSETEALTEASYETEQAETISDLSLWPYPFRKGNEFLPLTIVFSDDISDTELNLLGRIFAMKEGDISSKTDISVIRWENASSQTDRNQIIIGIGEKNGYLNDLLKGEDGGGSGCMRLVGPGVNDKASKLLLYGKDEESLSYLLRFLRIKDNINLLEGNEIRVDKDLNFSAFKVQEPEEPEKEETSAGRLTLMICVAAGILTAIGLIILVTLSIRDRKNERKV